MSTANTSGGDELDQILRRIRAATKRDAERELEFAKAQLERFYESKRYFSRLQDRNSLIEAVGELSAPCGILDRAEVKAVIRDYYDHKEVK